MNKLVGDRKFYKMILLIAVPIMIQNGITNFVNFLDNLMVGRIGTEQMSGVSIVNQLIFVYNLCIFGGYSGAGIFTAQFNGLGDNEGIKATCRFKLILGTFVTLLTFLILLPFGEKLISLYLNEGSEGDLEKTLEYGLVYLKIILWGLPLYMIVQAYGSTLRECGETVAPMYAGVAAVIVNLLFNYFLIYGKCGFPEMGVAGAAIATDISRVVEALIVFVWAKKHERSFPFVKNLLSSMRVPKHISVQIAKVGSPLLLNETLWAAGMAMLTQCYSMRGLDSVAGFNISSTVINVFKVVFIAMGNSVGIIVGKLLGAGKMDEAVDTDRKLIAFSVFICLFVGAVLYVTAPLYPEIYNTTENARMIASQSIRIGAALMFVDAYKSATYFTLRSGGRTWITFFFDSCFVWVVNVPLAFVLSRFSNLSSVQIFLVICLSDFIKVIVGTVLVKKRVWLRNIVL